MWSWSYTIEIRWPGSLIRLNCGTGSFLRESVEYRVGFWCISCRKGNLLWYLGSIGDYYFLLGLGGGTGQGRFSAVGRAAGFCFGGVDVERLGPIHLQKYQP